MIKKEQKKIPINIINYIIKNHDNIFSNKDILDINKKDIFDENEFLDILKKWNFNFKKIKNDEILQNLLNNLKLSKIKEIIFLWEEIAYDIEVEWNHNYFAWDILVSNCVYQEQIMQMAQDLAGYTLWEADILRRAIWKKKKKVIEEQRDIFVEKASKLWYEKEKVEKIYNDMILPAAEYSFNKSHAACYAYIAYQWAFLKTYYPAAYNVAVLMSEWDNLDRAAIAIEDIINNDIEVETLDINKSDVEYKYINDKKISIWLKLIKWVGIWDLKKIIDERNKNWLFVDFDNFLQRNKNVLNKKILSWLLFSWTLDNLIDQNKWIENIDRILNFLKKDKKNPNSETSLFSLFDNIDNNNWSKSIEFVEPKNKTTPLSKSINEIASTWLLIKNHPLDTIKTYIESLEINRKTLQWNKNTSLLNSKELEIRWMAIIMDLELKKTEYNWKINAKVKLLWTDYYINGTIPANLIHENEYELIWKSKDRPSWIYKLIEFNWRYSLNEYWRSIYITKIKFRNLEQIYILAKKENKLLKNDKCDWKKIIKYKNEELNYKKIATIFISDFLLKKENLSLYKEKLQNLKDFLLRHQKINWEFDIILKTHNWKIKETWISFSNKELLKNYIDKISWFKIVF